MHLSYPSMHSKMYLSTHLFINKYCIYLWVVDIMGCIISTTHSSSIASLRPGSYHSVLVVDLHHDDGGVIPQLAGLPEQLHVVKHQQLVPGGTQRLTQHLQTVAHSLEAAAAYHHPESCMYTNTHTHTYPTHESHIISRTPTAVTVPPTLPGCVAALTIIYYIYDRYWIIL